MQSFITDRAEKVGTAVFTSGQARNYGDDYLVRAAVILAGAMFPITEVSSYAEIFVNNTGTELSGTKAYKMTFAADAFPR